MNLNIENYFSKQVTHKRNLFLKQVHQETD